MLKVPRTRINQSIKRCPEMSSVTIDNSENYFMTLISDNLMSGLHRSEMSACYKFLCGLFLSAAGLEK
jgi:hypothetical protein